MGKTRSVDEIRADLARNRVRISDTLGDTAASLNPKRLARQGLNQAKSFVSGEFRAAKAQFVGPQGVDKRKVLIVAGAIVGTMVLFSTVNHFAHRDEREIEKRLRKAIEAQA